MEDDSVHFVSPGQVHLLQRDAQSFGFVILFSTDFYHAINASTDTLYDLPFFNNSFNASIKISAEKKLLLLNIIKRIKEECASMHTDKYELVYFYLQIVLLEFKRLYTQQIIAPNKKQGTELIFKFKKAVEKYFITEHAVSFYAKTIHVTPSYLSDIVHDNLGISPSQFIHNRIILEAKRILLHADKSVSEIAFALNFDDPSYFTRFFKKRVGLSPIDFRTIIRKKYQ